MSNDFENSKVFRTFEQRDLVLTGLSNRGYVTATGALPPEHSTPVGSVYLLTKFCRDYVPGIIYVLNEIDGKKMWMDITISQVGHLTKPSNFWKRITKDSIILHWDDPEDTTDPDDHWKNATWDYDVIVRKFGKDPESPEDGEVLGYSTVRNQYNESSEGFQVFLDEDDPDYDYHYAVFSCTISNVYTRSDVLKGGWTWPEIKDQINHGTHKRAFRVGDVIPMPRHAEFGVLHAIIVDFDRKPNQASEPVNSIVFQTQEVIGPLTFDNNELMYARTSDTVFMRNKPYYLRTTDGVYEQIEVHETKGADASRAFIGGSIADWRSRHIDINHMTDTFTDEFGRIDGYPIVYTLHPSYLYWVMAPDNYHDDLTIDERAQQSCVNCGDSNWHYSNIRDWLATRLGLTYETYLMFNPEDDEDIECHCGPGGCLPTCTCKHSMKRWWKLPRVQITHLGDLTTSTTVGDPPDLNTYWMWENFEGDQDWCTETNGWFSAVTDNWNNVAPGSLNSDRFIDKIPFQDGFPVEFTDLLYQHRCTTITDEIIWRYIRGGNQTTVPTYDAQYIQRVRPTITLGSERFWLPSYEEVYGQRPVYGFNGLIKTEDTKDVSEGPMFEFFKQHPEARVKAGIFDRTPLAWYTRSCDPTTVGRVFYVESYIPETDEVPEWTCTAHGSFDRTPVGAAPCFIVRAS